MIALTSMLTGLAVYLLVGVITDRLPRLLTGPRIQPVVEDRWPLVRGYGAPQHVAQDVSARSSVPPYSLVSGSGSGRWSAALFS